MLNVLDTAQRYENYLAFYWQLIDKSIKLKQILLVLILRSKQLYTFIFIGAVIIWNIMLEIPTTKDVGSPWVMVETAVLDAIDWFLDKPNHLNEVAHNEKHS